MYSKGNNMWIFSFYHRQITKLQIFFQQPTEEDPDEGVKDLVEIILKKMVYLIQLFCFL